MFEVSQRTVQRVVGVGLKNRKKTGRPPSLSKYTVKKILHQTRQNPTKSASSIAKGIGVKASDRTIQRILRENQFKKKRVKGRQYLSVKAMADRVAFVREHLENPSPIWSKVIFSDEKKWNLKANDGYVSYWCEKSRKYLPEVDLRRQPGIMVWGAICSNGAAFIARITGKITAEKYT